MVIDGGAQVVKEPSAVLLLPNEVRIGQNSNFRPLLKRLRYSRMKLPRNCSHSPALSLRERRFPWVLQYPCPFFEAKKPTARVQIYDFPHFHVTHSMGERMC